MELSVVVCTHNPREDYLDRTLASLRDQDLPQTAWEFILIDNASTPALGSDIDLSWHDGGRCVREEELGLTAARLRGISEGTGDWVLFVDDDNVLAPDFLREILRIAAKHPWIGAVGGQVTPEFETEPPPWTRQHLFQLALQETTEDIWCCSIHRNPCIPCGAGLCVRREVAEAYRRAAQEDPRRARLDRRGQSLLSAGDTDLALTACDLGLATGIFRKPVMRHLIPPRRLTEDYLLQLHEMQHASGAMLHAIRAGANPGPSRIPLHRWIRTALRNPRELRFLRAQQRGEKRAARLIAELN